MHQLRQQLLWFCSSHEVKVVSMLASGVDAARDTTRQPADNDHCAFQTKSAPDVYRLLFRQRRKVPRQFVRISTWALHAVSTAPGMPCRQQAAQEAGQPQSSHKRTAIHADMLSALAITEGGRANTRHRGEVKPIEVQLGQDAPFAGARWKC
jgi:hypothetical protein